MHTRRVSIEAGIDMFIPVDDDSTQNVFRLPEKLALPTLIDRGVSPCHCALMPPGQVSPSESEGSGDLREAFSNSAASGMAGFDMLAMLCRVLCGMLRVETKESEGFLAVRDCGDTVA
ncbi:predicted protein [Histoplasma capsulatum G186AR]|uniref:Uncharacterized protein n=1 Tax=Ajellomyces capsulatus (strain G186AR / H82 / ATCC MYA-2454 / RMSCC 2432) TaxID=447093 RepID=C0NAZ9_AJECG|nr:uncharacterized protein HCBG_00295 [Histoplasma capsulatum G186AR]EEH10840.1 predicted protein [Histoplasma capsulatum G186AR]